MAYSWQEETYAAGAENITVDIEYLDKSYIHLYLNGIETFAFSWYSDTLIHLNVPLTVPSLVTLVRRTDKGLLYIKFADGAAFIRENLDTQNTQFLHLAQELVEGRSISGFYGSISMNGYRITNLGTPIDDTDAVTKGYVDEYNQSQDARISGLENVFKPGLTTAAYPFILELTEQTDTVSPPFKFDKAEVYLDGLHQEMGYSVIVVDNTLVFAEALPVGTRLYAVLGENILPDDGLVSAAQFSVLVDRVNVLSDGAESQGAAIASLNTSVATLNTSVAALSTRVTPLEYGGTGNTVGRAATATKLDVPRGIRTNLASTSAVNFDGSADVTPGVTGTLPVQSGGTGVTTLGALQTALDVFKSTGVTDASNAGSGKVGEYLSADNSTAAVNAVSGTAANVVSLSLPAGDWELNGSVSFNSSNAALTGYSAGVNTVSATLPGFLDNTTVSATFTVGTQRVPVPSVRLNLTSTTTVYLVATAFFNSGAVQAFAKLRARRVR